MMVTVNWIGGAAFEADPPSGSKFVMDSHPDFGGTGRGPSPIEVFLSAMGACSAIDVLSILHKKQQKVTAYRIEVEGTRGPEGEYPRPFTSILIRHIVTGDNLDPRAVERAVDLSDAKYCGVISTLRNTPTVSSEYRIESASASQPA